MNATIALRHQISATVEALISILDIIDADPDAEPGTWPESLSARASDTLPDENREEDDPGEDNHDTEDDRADDEPSLGWAAVGGAGIGAFSDTSDLEQEVRGIYRPRDIRPHWGAEPAGRTEAFRLLHYVSKEARP